MTAVLCFLFARRFNRLDALTVSIASGLFGLSAFWAAIIVLIVGAFASVLGEWFLERRS